MVIKAKVLPRCSSDFSPAAFYSYAIKTFNTLVDFQQTVIHRCIDSTALLDTPLKAMLDLSHTDRELIMYQFRHLKSSNSTTSSQAPMYNNNNKRLENPSEIF